MNKGVEINPKKPEQKPQDERSFLFVEFDGIASVATKGIEFGHLTAFQMLALSGWLEFLAKSQLQREQQEREIAVARMQGIDLGELTK